MRITILLTLLLVAPLGVQARDLTIPDPKLTPGVDTGMSVKKICATAWGKDARHVTAAMKSVVFSIYGLKGNICTPDKHGRHCEIDHAWSRELGGADVIENLWPQPYGGKWNAVMKDRLENRLHKELCAGTITLDEAHDSLLPDWRVAYRRYFGEPK